MQVIKLHTLTIILLSSLTFVSAQDENKNTNRERYSGNDEHPHILVKPNDKKEILDKISKQEWARTIFKSIKNKLSPYVSRHINDPEWILSRYLMNRIPEKRYTDFISDAEGTALVSYKGDAPYPTVRVAPHKRPPISKDGYTYKQPTIEELVPYDTSMLMYMQVNSPDHRKEWANPQTFVDNINQRINQLALEASIIYWLDGDTTYAKFAADILTQWARGAYFQNPISGPCRTGFLSIQTLGDGSYEAMPLIYDFLYDYLRTKNYETKWYEVVFDKMANTMTFRGFWNNNWFAAQSPMLVYSALSLEDKKKRNFYLQYVMERDTINGACGHLSMPSVVKEWLTPDGHWKEPGGYHNYPVGNLLVAGIALEKNGYDVFKKFPSLIQASYVMLKYSFPNLMAASFGDTGPASQSTQSLEIGLLMAKQHQLEIFPSLMSAMQVIMEEKGYKRESSDYLGLLCYLPEITLSSSLSKYTWPRSGTLDFAKAFYQRNGADKKNGLMYVLQGASYNHNHANGMSMEIYGMGSVMGPDPGNGLTYEDPMHVGYYTQWAAHNTVVAGGISTSVPVFKGGGGTKQIGEITLKAMEPMVENRSVSSKNSFTTTTYIDKATNANQQRTMAIVRTSNSTGYYVDIFRSNHPKNNEYIYHNIGKEIKLFNANRDPIQFADTTSPLTDNTIDPSGFRFIKNLRNTGNLESSIIGIFSMKDDVIGKGQRFMQILVPGEKNRNYFVGMAPPTKTVLPIYNSMPTPTLIIKQNGEAWSRPFVAIFEPYAENGNNVLSVSYLDHKKKDLITALDIKNKNNTEQIVFETTENQIRFEETQWTFKGTYGLINFRDGKIEEIYLGDGNEISYGDFSILSKDQNTNASIKITDKKIKVSCNHKIEIRIKDRYIFIPASAEYEVEN